MIPLNLPKANLKLKRKKDVIFVWDIFRKKELLLTPEEWVRQHILHLLVNEFNYPSHLIASEYKIEVNALTRRCDAVVFGRDKAPKMIIECKEPNVDLDEKVLHQIAQYNFKLNVDYLILTNGLQTVICYLNRVENKIQYLEAIPTFDLIA